MEDDYLSIKQSDRKESLYNKKVNVEKSWEKPVDRLGDKYRKRESKSGLKDKEKDKNKDKEKDREREKEREREKDREKDRDLSSMTSDNENNFNLKFPKHNGIESKRRNYEKQQTTKVGSTKLENQDILLLNEELKTTSAEKINFNDINIKKLNMPKIPSFHSNKNIVIVGSNKNLRSLGNQMNLGGNTNAGNLASIGKVNEEMIKKKIKDKEQASKLKNFLKNFEKNYNNVDEDEAIETPIKETPSKDTPIKETPNKDKDTNNTKFIFKNHNNKNSKYLIFVHNIVKKLKRKIKAEKPDLKMVNITNNIHILNIIFNLMMPLPPRVDKNGVVLPKKDSSSDSVNSKPSQIQKLSGEKDAAPRFSLKANQNLLDKPKEVRRTSNNYNKSDFGPAEIRRSSHKYYKLESLGDMRRPSNKFNKSDFNVKISLKQDKPSITNKNINNNSYVYNKLVRSIAKLKLKEANESNKDIFQYFILYRGDGNIINIKSSNNIVSTLQKKNSNNLILNKNSKQKLLEIFKVQSKPKEISPKYSDEDNTSDFSLTDYDKKIQDSNKILTKEKEVVLRKITRQERVIDSNPEDNENDENDETRPYQKDENSMFLIDQYSFGINLWNLKMMILVLYVVISSPITLAFGSSWNIFTMSLEIYIDIAFLFDMILQFFITFKNDDDIEVREFEQISINYIFGWFFLDLFASMPMSSITVINYIEGGEVKDLSDGTGIVATINNSLKFFKFFRFVKLKKLLQDEKNDSELFKKKNKSDNDLEFEKIEFSNAFKRLIRFIFQFLIIIHFTSCVWIFIGKNDYPNWIFFTNLQDATDISIYVAAIYFNFCTIFTVGYGDIVPRNMYEMIFVLALELGGVLVYSFFLSSLSHILSNDEQAVNYMKNMEILNKIKHTYSISDEYYDKVLKFITYDLKFNRYERQKFLNEIPPRIRNTLLLNMYKDIIKEFKFFKYCDDNLDFKSQVVLALRPIKSFRKEVIIQEFDYVEELILVKTGVLSICLGFKFNEEKIMNVRKTEHFGDILMLSKQRSQIILKVISKESELFILKRPDLESIMQNHTEICKKVFRVSSYNYTRLLELMNDKMEKLLNVKMIEEELGASNREENQNFLQNLNNQLQDINEQKIILEEINEHIEEGKNIKEFVPMLNIANGNVGGTKSLLGKTGSKQNTFNNNFCRECGSHRSYNNDHDPIPNAESENSTFRRKSVTSKDLNRIMMEKPIRKRTKKFTLQTSKSNNSNSIDFQNLRRSSRRNTTRSNMNNNTTNITNSFMNNLSNNFSSLGNINRKNSRHLTTLNNSPGIGGLSNVSGINLPYNTTNDSTLHESISKVNRNNSRAFTIQSNLTKIVSRNSSKRVTMQSNFSSKRSNLNKMNTSTRREKSVKFLTPEHFKASLFKKDFLDNDKNIKIFESYKKQPEQRFSGTDMDKIIKENESFSMSSDSVRDSKYIKEIIEPTNIVISNFDVDNDDISIVNKVSCSVLNQSLVNMNGNHEVNTSLINGSSYKDYNGRDRDQGPEIITRKSENNLNELNENMNAAADSNHKYKEETTYISMRDILPKNTTNSNSSNPNNPSNSSNTNKTINSINVNNAYIAYNAYNAYNANNANNFNDSNNANEDNEANDNSNKSLKRLMVIKEEKQKINNNSGVESTPKSSRSGLSQINRIVETSNEDSSIIGSDVLFSPQRGKSLGHLKKENSNSTIQTPSPRKKELSDDNGLTNTKPNKTPIKQIKSFTRKEKLNDNNELTIMKPPNKRPIKQAMSLMHKKEKMDDIELTITKPNKTPIKQARSLSKREKEKEDDIEQLTITKPNKTPIKQAKSLCKKDKEKEDDNNDIIKPTISKPNKSPIKQAMSLSRTKNKTKVFKIFKENNINIDVDKITGKIDGTRYSDMLVDNISNNFLNSNTNNTNNNFKNVIESIMYKRKESSTNIGKIIKQQIDKVYSIASKLVKNKSENLLKKFQEGFLNDFIIESEESANEDDGSDSS